VLFCSGRKRTKGEGGGGGRQPSWGVEVWGGGVGGGGVGGGGRAWE